MTESEREIRLRFRVVEPSFGGAEFSALSKSWCDEILREELAEADFTLSRRPEGKPFLAPPHDDLHFSLSHTTGLIAIATTRSGPVGLDLERARLPHNWCKIAERLFPDALARLIAASEEERPALFSEAWCAFEASVKLTGRGLFGSDTRSKSAHLHSGMLASGFHYAIATHAADMTIRLL